MTIARSPLVAGLRAMARRRSVLVAYHGVAARAPDLDPHNLSVTPAAFRTQVELLMGAGFELVTVAELAQRAGGGRPPAGLAALSFDDGMDNNHSVLLPILQEYGIPATVYVTTGIIGQPNPWLAPGANARMMTEAELADLVAAGIELGAHTVTHPDMSLLDQAGCVREMAESRRVLQDRFDVPALTFAYPFCRYGPDAVAAAREAGFTAAVTCEGRGGWEPYELRRAMITGKDGLPSFVLKLADVYHPLWNSIAGQALRTGTRALRSRVRGDG